MMKFKTMIQYERFSKATNSTHTSTHTSLTVIFQVSIH